MMELSTSELDWKYLTPVLVAHMIDPASFWVVPLDDVILRNEIETELTDYFRDNVIAEAPSISPGELVAVLHPVRHKWMRAEVQRVGDPLSLLFMLDHAMAVHMETSSTRPLPVDFGEKFLSVRVHLRGVQPAFGPWSPESYRRVSALLYEADECYVYTAPDACDIADPVLVSSLLVLANNQMVDIGTELVQRRFGKWCKLNNPTIECQLFGKGWLCLGPNIHNPLQVPHPMRMSAEDAQAAYEASSREQTKVVETIGCGFQPQPASIYKQPIELESIYVPLPILYIPGGFNLNRVHEITSLRVAKGRAPPRAPTAEQGPPLKSSIQSTPTGRGAMRGVGRGAGRGGHLRNPVASGSCPSPEMGSLSSITTSGGDSSMSASSSNPASTTLGGGESPVGGKQTRRQLIEQMSRTASSVNSSDLSESDSSLGTSLLDDASTKRVQKKCWNLSDKCCKDCTLESDGLASVSQQFDKHDNGNVSLMNVSDLVTTTPAKMLRLERLLLKAAKENISTSTSLALETSAPGPSGQSMSSADSRPAAIAQTFLPSHESQKPPLASASVSSAGAGAGDAYMRAPVVESVSNKSTEPTLVPDDRRMPLYRLSPPFPQPFVSERLKVVSQSSQVPSCNRNDRKNPRKDTRDLLEGQQSLNQTSEPILVPEDRRMPLYRLSPPFPQPFVSERLKVVSQSSQVPSCNRNDRKNPRKDTRDLLEGQQSLNQTSEPILVPEDRRMPLYRLSPPFPQPFVSERLKVVSQSSQVPSSNRNNRKNPRKDTRDLLEGQQSLNQTSEPILVPEDRRMPLYRLSPPFPQLFVSERLKVVSQSSQVPSSNRNNRKNPRKDTRDLLEGQQSLNQTSEPILVPEDRRMPLYRLSPPFPRPFVSERLTVASQSSQVPSCNHNDWKNLRKDTRELREGQPSLNETPCFTPKDMVELKLATYHVLVHCHEVQQEQNVRSAPFPLTILENSVRECQTHILVDDTNSEQLPDIVELMQRLGAIILPILEQSAKDAKLAHESCKSHLTFCANMKAFGECTQDWNLCRARHALLPSDDSPHLPKSGRVMVKVLHVLSACRFSVNLLEIAGQKEQSLSMNTEIVRFAMEMALYFASSAHRGSIFPSTSGNDVVALETAPGLYQRACIESVITRDLLKQPTAVKVWMVDCGEWRTAAVDSLVELPERLKRWPARAVEVILCRAPPTDEDTEWSPAAYAQVCQWVTQAERDEHAGCYFVGDVVLRLGTTLWLDPLQVRRSLKMSETDILVRSFCLDLIERRLAVNNPQHLERLYDMCRYAGIDVDCYQSKKPRPVFEVSSTMGLPRPPVKPRWQHLQEDENCTVSFISALSPSQIYLRLTNFEGNLMRLNADIRKLMAKREAEPRSFLGEQLVIAAGTVCLAKFPDDCNWRRAVVCGISDDGAAVDVFFVDHGDNAKLNPGTELAPISDQLVEFLPFMAIECSLAGIKPLDEKSWCNDATDLLYDLTINQSQMAKTLNYRIVSKSESRETVSGVVYSVVLIDSSAADDSVLNRVLAERNLAAFDDESRKFFDDLPRKVPQLPTPPREDNVELAQAAISSEVAKMHGADKDAEAKLQVLKSLMHPKPLAPQPTSTTPRPIMPKPTPLPAITSADVPVWAGIPGAITPRVVWYQTLRSVHLSIEVVDVPIYNLETSPMGLEFSAETRSGKKYKLSLAFFGSIRPDRTEYVNTGRCISAVLHKFYAGSWLQLLSGGDRDIRWLRYYVDGGTASTDRTVLGVFDDLVDEVDES